MPRWLSVISWMISGYERRVAGEPSVDPRDALIRAQAERIEAQEQQIAGQAERITALEAVVADLREQLAAAERAGSREWAE